MIRIVVAASLAYATYEFTADYYIAGAVGLFIILSKWIYRFLMRSIKRKQYLRSSLAQIDKMQGHEFEELLEAHFKKLGYSCQIVGLGGHDYGVDLLIKKNGVTTAVQAKRYQTSVGIKAIQEAISGKEYYGADNAMVITNSFFTAPAIKMAEECSVELWNRYDCKKNFKIK